MESAAAPIPLDTSKLFSDGFLNIAKSLAANAPDLRAFFKTAWTILEPSTPMIEAYYQDYVLEHLEAVDLGQIKRLIINIPPRHGKSMLVSTIWPAWSWIERPWLRWVFASYSSSLATKLSIDRRELIESPWYRAKWGDVVCMSDDQNVKNEFQNVHRGRMISLGVGGSVTGKGGHRVVFDDLINPHQAESEAERESALRFLDRTLMTRLDDPENGVMIGVEQRTHALDTTAHILRNAGWTHVSLPAIAEKRTVLVFPLTKREVVREVGDLLSPQRVSLAKLEEMKSNMGTRAFAAQMQQNPTSEEGGLLKRTWWKTYRKIPYVHMRHWSWDTAMEEGEENDFTVGTLFNHCAEGTFISKVVRVRCQYPELRRLVCEEWNANPANALLIEDKVSGKSLGQDIRKHTNIPVLLVKPVGDKVFRVSLCSPYVESGRVHLPEDAPWVADFKEECAAFPRGPHDDQVDSFSQGMNHFYLNGGTPVAALSTDTGNGRGGMDWA
jgi:predicted phage terminase large subunit-like protein